MLVLHETSSLLLSWDTIKRSNLKKTVANSCQLWQPWQPWAISDQPCHSFTQLVESVARGSSTTSSHWKSLEATGNIYFCIGHPEKHHKNITKTGPKSSVYQDVYWHNILKHLKLRYSILQHVTACYSTFLEFSRVRSFDQVLLRKMEPAPEPAQPAHPIRRPYPSWPVSWWVFASRSLLSTWWNDAPRGLSLAPKHLTCAGTWVLIIKTLRFRVWLADMGTWGQAPSSASLYSRNFLVGGTWGKHHLQTPQTED